VSGETHVSAPDDERAVLVLRDAVPAAALERCLAARPDVEVTVERVDAEDAVGAARTGTARCLVAAATPDSVDLAALIERVREHRPSLPVVLVGDGETHLPPAVVAAGIEAYVPAAEGDGVSAEEGDGVAQVADAVDDQHDAAAVPEEPLGRLHSALVENVSDVLVTVDREGFFEYLSPAVEHVLDWSTADLVGEHSLSLVHPDDRPGVAAFFGDPTEWVGERRSHTFRFDDGAGGYVVVEAIAQNLLDDPAVEGVVLNCRDVTERERRERELELYETIVETVPVGLFVIDEESNIDLINQAGVETVDGKTEADLLASSVLDLVVEGYFDDALADTYVAGVRDLLSSGTDADRFVEDVAYHPPDGGETQYFNVHWGLRPMPDDEFRGTFVAFQEVTERKRYEEDLKRQNERLERFTQFVSHDLRNPLNVAKGYAVQARETGDERSIEEVEVSLERMEQLIEELLAMARDGQQVDEVVAVDLPDAAEEAWRTVVTEDATLDVADATVAADPAMLRQALENLFRNALDHVGPEVTVCVGPLADGFYVADDGPGIPADEREQVLELGYSTSPDGTGFGLGIVGQVAAAHDWTLAVTASESGGARFEFTGATG
jgi:PAS domain S-box-containing protein